MRLLLSLVLLIGLRGFALAQTTDVERLQGTWEITALLDEGKLVSDEILLTRFIHDGRLTFSGQSIVFTLPGSLQTRTILFALDGKANPNTIDLGGAERIGGQGIYMLSGDTLMICIGESVANPRPTEFSAKQGSPQLLMTLNRLPKTTLKPLPAAAPAPPPMNDDTARKLLIGTWGHQEEDWVVMFTLNVDGTFSSSRTYKDKFGKIFHEDVRSSGKWKLENAVVICSITASTDKNMVNQIFSYRIQTISATEVLAVDQFGKWRREWKAP